MSTPKSDYLTPSEYLELERKAEIKSEYIDGRMYAMSPGVSRNHSLITANLLRHIGNQLEGRRCEVHTPDLRVKVSRSGMYTYPDVSVVCGEAQFEDAHNDTLLNPTVIVEVLSPSSEAYDRGMKFKYYRGVESLQEYVLVAQNAVHIEHYVRESDRWVLTEIDSLDARLTLPSIACDVAVRDVYKNVELPVP